MDGQGKYSADSIGQKSIGQVLIVFMIAKGELRMEYRIENKEAFRITGISQPLSQEMEKNFEVIPKMWADAAADGTLQKLAGLINLQPRGILGVSVCGNEEPWKYFIAVASSKKEDGLEEYMVPASAWAVFAGSGTNTSLQEMEQKIFSEWLPASGYEYGKAPDIEVYLNMDPEDTQYEIWIPVIQK